MIRVLFVCMGNICRSPMAEAVFQHMVKEAGLENDIEADSAGTGDWHIGKPAHHGTLAVLRENSIEYDGRGRCLQPADMNDFDYIVTMDEENLAHTQHMHRKAGGSAKVAPLLEYGAQARKAGIHEVPDPYFHGGFDSVFLLVKDGCAGLLETICREHNL
jgi:protein-tyrosine phosphatase